MSNDESDLVPYTAPTSVFNDPLPEAKPAVPELSVLLDQEKIQSLHSNLSPVRLEKPDFQNQYEMSQQRPNIVPGNDKQESYNSWKARHAEELNKITSSSRKSDMDSKRYSSSRKPSESQSNRSTPSANGGHSVKRSSTNVESHNYAQNYAPPRSDFIGEDQHQVVLDSNNDFNTRYSRNPHGNMPPRQYYQQQNVPQYGENGGFNDQNRYNPRDFDGQVQHFGHPPGFVNPNDQRFNGYQTVNQPAGTRSNQRMGFHPISGYQYPSEDLRKPLVPGVVEGTLPFNGAQINNQTIQELYQVVHLQNQQMNAAIALLQQQVKQLQLSLESGKNTGEEKDACVNCSCGQKGKDKSVVNCSSSPKKKVGKDSSNKKIQVSPKRSVGVMANISEGDEEESSEKSEIVQESRYCKPSRHRSSNMKETKPVSKKIISNKEKKSPKTLEEPKASRAKKNYISAQEKKQSKKPLKKSSTQNYNPANETKQVHNESEDNEESSHEDCDSSNPSIHINLQDYSSSNDSDSDFRNGSDNSGSQSESESQVEGSSVPKLGWTFYNQVVDQVNNIVKKNPAKPKQDRTSGSRKILPRKEDYEMENNWSKRVTFHGPPPSSSDDFMVNMMPNAHFQPILENQEYHNYQTNGHPERLQDVRMYNVANGNTNMSFTTLRYLERFDLLPPQFNSKRQDYNLHQAQDYQQPRNYDMKQKKTHPEVYQQPSQSNHRRKSRDSRR